MHSLKDKAHLQKMLERKFDSARIAQHRLYEAEAQVEAKNWEKRNPDIAYHEINNLNDFNSIAPSKSMGRSRSEREREREKISLYGELIEELKSICCEEADRARQAKIEELQFQEFGIFFSRIET